ncbi:HAD hydrolase, family IIID [Kwoniella shandongensis]|uniref:HAD hydrolase, family IIID n=1 Tax=Kwoniella shandongensis TaxID=1734106 RepID=A0A5M6CCW3_9TREE|nr:HAD hydrolase, family IIID [Kwoniella shandongensis]KAA5531285.1 HAD hydrolase, family IIID [Kwoniella shandongensis]
MTDLNDIDSPSSSSSSSSSAGEEDKAPVTALPDVQSSPSEGKKAKLFHVDGAEACDAEGKDNEVEEKHSLDTSPTEDDGRVESGSKANEAMDVEEVEEKDSTDSPTFTAVPLTEELEIKEEWWELKMSWSGKTFDLRVGGNDMVYDFRHLIETTTGVSRDNQKLIGLLPGSKGKLGTEHDAKRFATLGVKKGGKFVLVGTREEERFKDPTEWMRGEITDDFDVAYSNAVTQAKTVAPADDPRNKRLVQEIVNKSPITYINEPREGKRLLVLDLDYTMVDTKPLLSGALPASQCARPGLHEFLERVYPYYDIAIWSQTNWRWLETKLIELGVVGGTHTYKICFVSDRTTMFPVFTQRNGQPYKHEVKPLAYFWASNPKWSARNTIHIDDLARNFALNPGEGLKIRAFNKAGHTEGRADRELYRLGQYLVNIAVGVEDFTKINHSDWKKTVPRM